MASPCVTRGKGLLNIVTTRGKQEATTHGLRANRSGGQVTSVGAVGCSGWALVGGR